MQTETNMSLREMMEYLDARGYYVIPHKRFDDIQQRIKSVSDNYHVIV